MKPQDILESIDDTDPRSGLQAVAALTALLRRMERVQVLNARRHGWSWERIAAELGITRQAAHKRFRHWEEGR